MARTKQELVIYLTPLLQIRSYHPQFLGGSYLHICMAGEIVFRLTCGELAERPLGSMAAFVRSLERYLIGSSMETPNVVIELREATLVMSRDGFYAGLFQKNIPPSPIVQWAAEEWMKDPVKFIGSFTDSVALHHGSNRSRIVSD